MGRIREMLKSITRRKKSDDETPVDEIHDPQAGTDTPSREKPHLFKRATSAAWRGIKSPFKAAGKAIKRPRPSAEEADTSADNTFTANAADEIHDPQIDKNTQSGEKESFSKEAESDIWRGVKYSFGLAEKAVKGSGRLSWATGKSLGRLSIRAVVNLGRGMNTLSQVVNILHFKGRENNITESEKVEEQGKAEKQSPMGLLKEHQEFIVLLLKIILWPVIPLAKLYARCPKCAITLVVLASVLLSIFVIGKTVILVTNEFIELCRNMGWCEMPPPEPGSDAGAVISQ